MQEWRREETSLVWGLGFLDQEFLITDLLELYRLLSGLGAVNHKTTAAGVAMTSPWPSCTLSSSPSFPFIPASHSSCSHASSNTSSRKKNLNWKTNSKCSTANEFGCKRWRYIIPINWKTYQFVCEMEQFLCQTKFWKSVLVVLLIFLLAGSSADIWNAVCLAITTAEQIRCSHTSQDHIIHSTENHCHSLTQSCPPPSPLVLSLCLFLLLPPSQTYLYLTH